jgi:hypothetical protein
VLELVEVGTGGDGEGPVSLRESGWERKGADPAEGAGAGARLKKERIDWD